MAYIYIYFIVFPYAFFTLSMMLCFLDFSLLCDYMSFSSVYNNTDLHALPPFSMFYLGDEFLTITF
jgi:hypothetical protein